MRASAYKRKIQIDIRLTSGSVLNRKSTTVEPQFSTSKPSDGLPMPVDNLNNFPIEKVGNDEAQVQGKMKCT